MALTFAVCGGSAGRGGTRDTARAVSYANFEDGNKEYGGNYTLDVAFDTAPPAFAVFAKELREKYKNQSTYENIPTDSIQVINKTCLILKVPNEEDFDDESMEALFDFSYYASETNVRFGKLGIGFITAKKRGTE